MIWYRHWLEMRWGLLAVVAFVVVWAYLDMLLRGPVEDALLRGPVEADDVMEWFALRVWSIGYMCAMLIGGCGLRGLWHLHAHSSTFFTLSLPVSRERIVLTRLAATLAAAVLIDVQFAGFAVVWFGGGPGQQATLELTGLLAVSLPVLFGYIAVAAALSCFLHPLWYGVATILIALVLALVLVPTLGEPGSGDGPPTIQWLVAGGFAVAGAVAVALTLRYGTRREY